MPAFPLFANPSPPYQPELSHARPRRAPMCTLQEHIERDTRQQTAKRLEPIYAALAKERGIPYQGPEQGPFSFPCPETQGEQ